jgi:hypothetical protein
MNSEKSSVLKAWFFHGLRTNSMKAAAERMRLGGAFRIKPTVRAFSNGFKR